METTADPPPVLSVEQKAVVAWRFAEARAYGLTLVEARLYADTDIDCGLLRKLRDGGCPPETAARVLF